MDAPDQAEAEGAEYESTHAELLAGTQDIQTA